ncbi:uncharacterized protein LOC143102032 [Alosa pseudoharengus]|uniref:uncharacterized protein LOC143102032 n=1 Tax=Alosa pseudoharengus TaxID=34774 RepID=UPI003F88F0B3
MDSQYKESEVCIIHHETSKEGDEIFGLKDYESWKTLLDAAKVRNYAPITDVAKDLREEEVPRIHYHRKCRSLFTMKRELKTLKRKATENITDEAGENSLPKKPTHTNTELSYSQLEENNTALCLQKLATASNQRVVLPASIKPHVFTNLAWDNIDRLEETLTGKGTSHRVNGIVVQANFYGPHLSRTDFPHIEKQKQRSVTIEDQGLEVYVAGARVGPQPLPTREHYIQETKEAALLARKKTMVWALARQTDPENQTIPSWTGFNISTRDQEPISQDIVGYLPTINSPATELNTVFEILKQLELMRKELHLETIVVVMDQALYAKAAEITWKHREWFPNILLWAAVAH